MKDDILDTGNKMISGPYLTRPTLSLSLSPGFQPLNLPLLLLLLPLLFTKEASSGAFCVWWYDYDNCSHKRLTTFTWQYYIHINNNQESAQTISIIQTRERERERETTGVLRKPLRASYDNGLESGTIGTACAEFYPGFHPIKARHT